MIKNKVLRSGIILLLFIQCFSELFAQPANDNCETATIIDTFPSDQAFLCFEGTTLGALPETINNSCSIGEFAAVWFQITTDGNASLINIQVTSQDFNAPTISLLQQISDCNNLQLVGLTQSNFDCVMGSNGEAEASGTDVEANSIYYIVVSGINTAGGAFQLCVNTISPASICVTDRNIEIVSRSSGGPFEGPFLPGERIGICLNVNSFTAANNGCQWFQGIVPVFGNGWDPSSFDPNGQPTGATINGNAMGVPNNGLYGTSIWDWFTDVDYHYNHPFHQVGDIDGNLTMDMCNILYDPDCPDFGGLTGSCCGPCWEQSFGTILPPGWFAYGINGSCQTPGPPIRVDWGDGNTCGGGMGPWSFCFELTVRDYPHCLEDATTSDLSIGFFTFADGEIGSWTGNASNCGFDQPVKISIPMCCTELNTSQEEADPVCTGGIFTYEINEPSVEYWYWTIDAGGVTGAHSGQGGSGTVIMDTLLLQSSSPGEVLYTFLGFANGQCPVFQKDVVVEVFPPVEVSLDSIGFCSAPNNPYTIVPEITGGTGNFEYMWLPGGETTPTITVVNPANGSQFFLTVTDIGGCSDEASTIITFGASLPVDILAPIVEQCEQDGPILLEAIPNGGVAPFVYEWTLPNGFINSGSVIDAFQTGDYIVEVTDSEGCTGIDTIMVTLNSAPVVIAVVEGGSPVICEGNSIILTGNVTSGEEPFSYTWITPQGMESGQNLVVSMAGGYSVAVEDANGCTGYSNTVFVTVEPLPVPDLGPDTITSSGAVVLDAGPGFVTYTWSSGQATQTILVNTTGDFVVCVTDNNGCVGCDTVHVDIITNTIDLADSGYLNIFPNPNNGLFMVSGELAIDEEIGITVTNTIGQILYASKPASVGTKISKEIDLGKAASGVYYVQIMIGEERYVRKVVVE